MKKKVAWLIVIIVACVAIFYVWNYINIMETKAKLCLKVDKYYSKTSKRAAVIAFQLTRPYLTTEKVARYSQRLDLLARPGVTIGFHLPSDSYCSFMWDIATKEAIRETERKQIIRLCQALQGVNFISLEIKSSSSRQEIKQVREDFVDAKKKMEQELLLALKK